MPADAEVSAATSSDRGADLGMSDPRGIASVEPDGGNLLVRIWEGLGRGTGRGYSTNDPLSVTEIVRQRAGSVTSGFMFRVWRVGTPRSVRYDRSSGNLLP